MTQDGYELCPQLLCVLKCFSFPLVFPFLVIYNAFSLSVKRSTKTAYTCTKEQ